MIAAGAGVAVGKHGNRAATSRSGSADVLEAMGVPLDVPADAQSAVLREARIAFFFAQAHHPAMKHAGPIRKELGIRTIFNCLGPLANPAGATHQLLGAYDDGMRPVLAKALRGLGTKRAWVVRSTDGMDEMSPHAATRVTELSGGSFREFEIAPEDFGLARSPAGAIQGGDPKENAAVLELVLDGKPHASRDAFLLNAAAALVVAEGTRAEASPRQGARIARERRGPPRSRRLEAHRERAPRGGLAVGVLADILAEKAENIAALRSREAARSPAAPCRLAPARSPARPCGSSPRSSFARRPRARSRRPSAFPPERPRTSAAARAW